MCRRVRIRVWAVAVPGVQKNSKWSAPAIRLPRVSTSWPRGSLSSAACSRNVGSHTRVTLARTPMAPRPTRAAWNSSGRCSAEHSTSSPSAVTRLRATTCWEREPKARPVPWVPVETAPATVCQSLSGRLVTASPWASSSWFRSRIVVPARTVTRWFSRSTAGSPDSPERSTMTSGARGSAEKLHPEPTARTPSPRRTAAATPSASSGTEVGRSTCRGVTECVLPHVAHSLVPVSPGRASGSETSLIGGTVLPRRQVHSAPSSCHPEGAPAPSTTPSCGPAARTIGGEARGGIRSTADRGRAQEAAP